MDEVQRHRLRGHTRAGLAAAESGGRGGVTRLAEVLRHIRVTCKQELMDRIMAAIDYTNRHPRHSHLGRTRSTMRPDMIRSKETMY